MGRRRKHGRSIDGILLLDKPRTLTSNEALQRVKRLYKAAKAGHTGSLDPLATGVWNAYIDRVAANFAVSTHGIQRRNRYSPVRPHPSLRSAPPSRKPTQAAVSGWPLPPRTG